MLNPKEIAQKIRDEDRIPIDDKLVVLKNIAEDPIGEVTEEERWKALDFMMDYCVLKKDDAIWDFDDFWDRLDELTLKYFID